MPGNLAERVDSFVGRHRERTALSRLLRAQRLVTVVGPVGVGKTRLAVEVAGSMSVPGGVWFVDLAAVVDPAQVDQAVAASVQAERLDGGTAREALAVHLTNQQVLLLLDNCEHVVDSCADLVAWLLPRCPGVKVLATSRETMRISGEHAYTLGPLPVASDAVRLFADRASAVDHEFRMTPAVAELCARLDGLPLAIELAARQVRHLYTASLSELLRNGERTAERHRSLDTAIFWSYDLLDPREQVVLRRLSVLAGRFGVELASAACDIEDVLDLLVSLTAKSLVVVDDGKFRLLEAIRVFGQARLREHGEYDATYQRLMEWFVRAWEPQAVRYFPELATMRMLKEQADTLAAVHDWAVRAGDERSALLTWGLGLIWVSRGHLVEAKALALRALDRGTEPRMRAPLLSLTGSIDSWMGNDARAVDTYRVVVEIEEGLDRPGRLARAHGGLAVALEKLDDLDGARKHHLAALRLLRQIDEQPAVANTLHNLGNIAIRAGDLTTARVELEEAREITTSHGMTEIEMAAMWHTFGELEVADGNLHAAEQHFVQSIRTKPDLPYQVVYGLAGLASVAAERGEHERAVRIADAALNIQLSVGVPEPHWQRGIDRIIEVAIEQIGARRVQNARMVGRRMSMTQAVNFALDGVHEDDSPLSSRQLEISRSVAAGWTDRQIADDLGVSTRTINTYLEEIRNTLGVRSRAELAAWIAHHDSGGRVR